LRFRCVLLLATCCRENTNVDEMIERDTWGERLYFSFILQKINFKTKYISNLSSEQRVFDVAFLAPSLQFDKYFFPYLITSIRLLSTTLVVSVFVHWFSSILLLQFLVLCTSYYLGFWCACTLVVCILILVTHFLVYLYKFCVS
jgi:hypothetical protein